MPARSKSSTAAITIHDSDSEPETSRKRQKTTNAHMTLSSASSLIDLSKNSHLKGRKRFNADLSDLKEEVKAGGITVYELTVKRVRAGDDEGSVEVEIARANGNPVLSLNLLTSDTADYPKAHSFFSYCPDGDLPANISDVIEDIQNAPSLTIGGLLMRICTHVAKSLGIITIESQSQEPEDDESDDDYEPFEDFDVGSSNASQTQLNKLQNDFVDVVASQYRPGVIRFGADDFCLSVSFPVISLAESIPARALVAWDRRLLSKTQHLTLLISGLRGIYPIITPEGTLVPTAQRSGVQLNFKVGLCGRYKPSKEHAQEACRNFGLIVQDAEDELRIQEEKLAAEAAYANWDETTPETPLIVEEQPEDEGRFDKFSLSSSLESLLNQSFLKLVHLRRTFGLGWAGAEALYAMVENSQRKAEDIMKTNKTVILKADKDEQALLATNILPHDPLHHLPKTSEVNLPLTAFSYLVRRLTLCTRFCVVCHNKLASEFEVLKPYVCDNKLCQYQFYSLNRGPSLEYEIIHNPLTVDLLVCLTYSAAAEGVMEDLPVGMGLRVNLPPDSALVSAPDPRGYIGGNTPVPASEPVKTPFVANDGLCEFDELSARQQRAAVAALFNSLPSIDDMKKHLLRKVKPGKSKPKLAEIDANILPAAWQLLRWCVGSCTAYLEDITSSPESVQNLDPHWRQFRFTVGAPDAESRFKLARDDAVKNDANAKKYPSLYAFHGSPLRNWHSIVRHGLWFKTIANGRAYGNGIYLAKDATVSMGHYAQGNRIGYWGKSKVCPTSCVALAELVNLPSKFVSSNPYFVISETSWIICRYLLVKGSLVEDVPQPVPAGRKAKRLQPPFVNLDPAHPTTLANKKIEIPVPGFDLDNLLQDRRNDLVNEDADADDQAIFAFVEPPPADNKGKGKEVIELEDSDVEMYDFAVPAPAPVAKVKAVPKSKPVDDWKHDSDWVEQNVAHLFPPPVEASPSATMAVQRELKAMLREQESCNSFKELGWYMPPDRIGDNLFQWIVEMHSFDPALPIAKDLADKKVNSIVFEIRFPPNFPLSPPFFRIITPRFLPFIHGGGGHVTGGGSICMDLLTADGWLPSYSIPAVLIQIKLAISNLDPRPARLDHHNWSRNYGVHEALEGFKRAAATHGWQVPLGLEKLIR